MAMRAMMPKRIYGEAKELASSTHLGGGSYKWPRNGRLVGVSTQASMALPGGRATVNFKPHWTASKFEGMVRFQQVGPQLPGHDAARSSTYLTFRTLMSNSPKWHIPAFAGRHLLEKTLSAENVAKVREIVYLGVLEDLAEFAGGVGL